MTATDGARPAPGGELCSCCRHAMLPVTLGWRCPACHATIGEPEPAAH